MLAYKINLYFTVKNAAWKHLTIGTEQNYQKEMYWLIENLNKLNKIYTRIT